MNFFQLFSTFLKILLKNERNEILIEWNFWLGMAIRP